MRGQTHFDVPSRAAEATPWTKDGSGSQRWGAGVSCVRRSAQWPWRWVMRTLLEMSRSSGPARPADLQAFAPYVARRTWSPTVAGQTHVHRVVSRRKPSSAANYSLTCSSVCTATERVSGRTVGVTPEQQRSTLETQQYMPPSPPRFLSVHVLRRCLGDRLPLPKSERTEPEGVCAMFMSHLT